MKDEVVLKYSEALDVFLQIRVLTRETYDNFLKEAAATRGRGAYQVHVIRRCIVGAESGLKKLLDSHTEKELPAAPTAEHLYHLCIDVNPALEIHGVSIPPRRRTAVYGETAPQPDPAFERETAPLKIEKTKIADLEGRLTTRIIGQDESVSMIVRGVKRSMMGMQDPKRPRYVALLLGPTGTGKTETVKEFTKAIYGDLSRLVRVDCSEFALPHEYAKLIGAPPGYIGHNEGGFLTETVKEKKNCVVLLDEIEKAHSKVHHLLLQVMDEGILTDGKGTQVSFKETFIFMTSNLGAETVDKLLSHMGFSQGKTRTLSDVDKTEWDDAYRRAARSFFKPEFRNRLDDVLVYHAFQDQQVIKIAELKLKEYAQRLAETQKTVLEWTPEAVAAIVGRSDYANFGARDIKRIIDKQIIDPLIDRIVIHDSQVKGMTVTYENDSFVFQEPSRLRKQQHA